MEFTFELTPDDYRDYRRLEGRSWRLASVAVALVVPSLAILYLGGFRITLAIVTIVLGMLIYGGFQAAERLRRQRFNRHRCAPVVVRTADEHLEVDGFIEWRRLHWSYVESVESRRQWLVVSFFESEPLTIPPRALTADQRDAFISLAESAIDSAGSRSDAQLREYAEIEDETEHASIYYTIDNDYMRQLVELRFTDKTGWSRVALSIVMTGIVAAVWRSAQVEVLAAGAAITLPLIGLRLVETTMRKRALRQSELAFELAMQLALHDAGYERRCPMFQSFTSWSLVDKVQLHQQYLVFSHSDEEHLLAPASACAGEVTPEIFQREAMELNRLWKNEELEEEDRTEQRDDVDVVNDAPDSNDASAREASSGEAEPGSATE